MLEQSRANLGDAIAAVGRAHSVLAGLEGTRPVRDALRAMKEDLEDLARQLDELSRPPRRPCQADKRKTPGTPDHRQRGVAGMNEQELIDTIKGLQEKGLVTVELRADWWDARVELTPAGWQAVLEEAGL